VKNCVETGTGLCQAAWDGGPKCALEECQRDPAKPEVSAQHPLSRRFHEVLKNVAEMHDRKSKDYGRDEDPFANVRAATEFGVPAWLGAAIRMNDKMRRLQAFATRGELANEGVEDSFLDLAVYAVIGLILFEEEQK
jgi:hypothetical protein